jgi:hypothetical protein
MAAYVAELFGVGLLWPLEAGQETPPPEKPNSIKNEFSKTNMDRRFQIWFFSKPKVLASFFFSLFDVVAP